MIQASFSADLTPRTAERKEKSKYHRIITKVVPSSDLRHVDGGFAIDIELDFYDIANAWRITNPATQHCMKKLFAPGERNGGKSKIQDYIEALKSLERAIELEEENDKSPAR